MGDPDPKVAVGPVPNGLLACRAGICRAALHWPVGTGPTCLEAKIRVINKQVQADPSVTNTQRADAGLPVYSTTRNPVPVPTTAPMVHLESSMIGLSSASSYSPVSFAGLERLNCAAIVV